MSVAPHPEANLLCSIPWHLVRPYIETKRGPEFQQEFLPPAHSEHDHTPHTPSPPTPPTPHWTFSPVLKLF